MKSAAEQLEEEKKLLELAELQARPLVFTRDRLPSEPVHKYGKQELLDVKDEDRVEIEGILGIVDRSELLLCELSASPVSHSDIPLIALSSTGLPGGQATTPAVEAESKHQARLVEIFKGDSERSKLKRFIAKRYIDCNPKQAEMVPWLQLQKRPIPPDWKKKYGLVDWMDAFKKRQGLVKRYLSGITGRLRKYGYTVGRT